MKRRYEFAARREFDEAVDYYESKRAGLGRRFTRAIERVLEQILEQPDRFAEAMDEVREAPVLKFPYAIYYSFAKDTVVILSVFHTSRNPDVWQDRTR